MSSALEEPWTRERFLDWVVTQERRYEFDGFRPIAMTGGTLNHNAVMLNLHASLRSRLRGTRWSCFGPDVGVATIGDKIRYPEVLITCTKSPGTDQLTREVVTVFEVVNPSSAREDRVVKLREYQAVASIRRYVILESSYIAVTVLEKMQDGAWRDTGLKDDDALHLPEVGLEIPVNELYEEIEFPAA